MKILMTGASGFIGSRVVKRLLELNNEVIALSSKDIQGVKTLSSGDYKFNRDYLKDNLCDDVDVLLMLGAFTPKSGKELNDLDRTSGNIFSTQKILDLNFIHLSRVVYISSLDVFGEYNGVIREDTQTYPSTMYGWSKLYCEQMIMQYCIQKDISYNILRLGHVYGEGEEVYRKVMPIMIQNALRDDDIVIYGDGKSIRSFIYIDDVVEAIVNAVIEDNITDNIINVVGNEEITINELAKKIKIAADSNSQIIHEDSTVSNRDCIFDNKILLNTLLKSLTSFDTGLQREVEYMRRKQL